MGQGVGLPHSLFARTSRHTDRREPLEAAEPKELGRRHAGDSFDLSDLQARQGGADWICGTKCAAYGLDEQAITGLRQWA
ncbi:hypothetical protein [Streptomyces sp. NPDC088755]|uniref:hypothetical protein n=1 Tax=Streptomyces sp. NPDC088755 TaxID=3365888 RepID=UPI00380438B2